MFLISVRLAKIDDGTKGDWYTLDWLGYFYDASGGWIYHVELDGSSLRKVKMEIIGYTTVS